MLIVAQDVKKIGLENSDRDASCGVLEGLLHYCMAERGAGGARSPVVYLVDLQPAAVNATRSKTRGIRCTLSWKVPRRKQVPGRLYPPLVALKSVPPFVFALRKKKK